MCVLGLTTQKSVCDTTADYVELKQSQNASKCTLLEGSKLEHFLGMLPPDGGYTYKTYAHHHFG